MGEYGEIIEKWITDDGTRLAYGKLIDEDSELSNGDDTYAATYASRPGHRPQGDATLTGRTSEPGVESASIGDVTVIADFPQFVKITGYTGAFDDYAKEVSDYYTAWSEGHHYYIRELDEDVESHVVHRNPTRELIESWR